MIHSNSSLRIDEKDGSKTRFEAAGLTVVRGDTAKLLCPIYANPKPEIIWRLADNRQILGSGETLTINKVEDQHDGKLFLTNIYFIFFVIFRDIRLHFDKHNWTSKV